MRFRIMNTTRVLEMCELRAYPMCLPCSKQQHTVVSQLFKFTGQKPTWRNLRTASCWPSTRWPTLPCAQNSLAEDGLCLSRAPLRAFRGPWKVEPKEAESIHTRAKSKILSSHIPKASCICTLCTLSCTSVHNLSKILVIKINRRIITRASIYNSEEI